jgi:CheY-like chemotaxis protein
MYPKLHAEMRNFTGDCTMFAPTQTSHHPRILLAHSDSVYATLSCRRFRRLGWDVYLVGTALEARHLARILRPESVVLDVRLRDESGWLACDKLVRECPDQKVVLLTTNVGPESHRFAAFVGASALVPHEDGIQALVDEVHGAVLAAAG